MDASSNTGYAGGGLSFSPFVTGDSFGAGSGGFHFDLPLAALQTMQNNALAFTAANNQADQGFLKGVLDRSAATVDAASQRSAGINLTALNAGWSIGAGNLNLADTISARATSTAQLQINQQASVARYLSDNAARTAQYSVQQTTSQIQTTQKSSIVKKVLGLFTGGFF
jgi:hypothetical protein